GGAVELDISEEPLALRGEPDACFHAHAASYGASRGKKMISSRPLGRRGGPIQSRGGSSPLPSGGLSVPSSGYSSAVKATTRRSWSSASLAALTLTRSHWS